MKSISFFRFVLIFSFFLGCKKETEKIVPQATNYEEIQSLPYFNSADFTPEWKKGEHKIPNFSFENQHGEIVTNETYKGKIYVADFFFTKCPGICPKLTKNMKFLQDTYATDTEVMLLSHSVMPWYDTQALLLEYAKTNGIDHKKWNLVRGDKNEIYKIARTGYFADEDFTKTQDDSKFIHTENFILIDKYGYIRGVYNGTIPLEVERLKRHIKLLKNEV